MYIIIHRNDVFKIQETFGYFVSLMQESGLINTNVSITRSYITIGDVRIDFRCGDSSKMGGVRPNYYNTDDDEVSYFLQLMADKVNGKEIKRVEDLISIIKEYLYEKEITSM